MIIGMLWFDNSPADSLAVKVQRAADYYARKYGRTPTACYTHPTGLAAQTVIAGVTIKPNRSVMPNHYWIGVEDAP